MSIPVPASLRQRRIIIPAAALTLAFIGVTLFAQSKWSLPLYVSGGLPLFYNFSGQNLTDNAAGIIEPKGQRRNEVIILHGLSPTAGQDPRIQNLAVGLEKFYPVRVYAPRLDGLAEYRLDKPVRITRQIRRVLRERLELHEADGVHIMVICFATPYFMQAVVQIPPRLQRKIRSVFFYAPIGRGLALVEKLSASKKEEHLFEKMVYATFASSLSGDEREAVRTALVALHKHQQRAETKGRPFPYHRYINNALMRQIKTPQLPEFDPFPFPPDFQDFRAPWPAFIVCSRGDETVPEKECREFVAALKYGVPPAEVTIKTLPPETTPDGEIIGDGAPVVVVTGAKMQSYVDKVQVTDFDLAQRPAVLWLEGRHADFSTALSGVGTAYFDSIRILDAFLAPPGP